MAMGDQRPARSDIALAAGMAIVANLELLAPYAFEREPVSAPSAVHFAFASVMGVLLVWRRIFPLLVAPAVWALVVLQAFTTVQPNVYGEILIAILALYSLVVYAPTLRAAFAPAVVSLVCAAVLGTRERSDPVGGAVTNVLFSVLLILAAAAVRQQRGRAERLRRERDHAAARVREITVEERARIARDLHDVVAHGMSVVVLQARGARRVLHIDQARAEQALNEIERVASDCLDEMRRLVGILRNSVDGEAPVAPQPRMAELQHLVDQARTSGASVELVVEGERRDLPPAVELSMYRILQEALTNALRHAPGSRTRVRLRYREEDVSIEVLDDGPGTDGGEPGHGLIGMRERAELFGGTFTAGAEPGGGFGVRARLPVGGAP
jgi:signal transduction histidine kinase